MWRRLRAGVPLTVGPSWVQIGIDERCNYRCAMCAVHSYRLPKQDRRRVLSRQAFEGLVAQLSELGTQRLDIAGTGEPLLHPDAIEMLGCVKAAGMRCTLITNGSLLTPEVCDSLVEMGLDSVNVSLNAASDETHHRVTRVPLGEWSRIVRAMRYLVESRARRGGRGPCVSASFIIQRDSFTEVLKLAQEAVESGFHNVEYVALGVNDASRELQLAPEDEAVLLEQMREAARVLAASGVMTNASRYLSRPPRPEWSKPVVSDTACTIGQFFCRIHTDGSVDPCGCSRRVVGDVTRQTVRQVWLSQAYRAFRREAFSLPRLGKPLDECGCYTCGHAQTIINYEWTLGAGLLPAIP